MLFSNQWRNGEIVNCPDMFQLGQMLDGLLTKVRRSILKMLEDGYVDIESIPERIQSEEQQKVTFIEFCNQRAVIRKYNKEKDSQERYNRFLRLFTEWGKIRTFNDVTEMNIISYDKHLADKGMKPYSKWNNYHRFLNGFILDAIDAGFIQRNPYRWVYIDKGKSVGGVDKYLTLEEL